MGQKRKAYLCLLRGEEKSWVLFLYRTLYSLKKLVLFTNPSTLAGYDTRSIFKQSLTGLKSEFSFS